jgi:hypothetical protein
LIKEAAIQRRSDGKVWTGKRHGDVFPKIIKELGIQTVTHKEFIQGFVTDEGRFVDRQEAFKIAVACDQLINKEDPWSAPTLMSEDLY